MLYFLIKKMQQETRTIQGNVFQKRQDGYRCECGALIKKEATLEKHLSTKSHVSNKERRKFYGNTTIHVSLLTPGQIVYR